MPKLKTKNIWLKIFFHLIFIHKIFLNLGIQMSKIYFYEVMRSYWVIKNLYRIQEEIGSNLNFIVPILVNNSKY